MSCYGIIVSWKVVMVVPTVLWLVPRVVWSVAEELLPDANEL